MALQETLAGKLTGRFLLSSLWHNFGTATPFMRRTIIILTFLCMGVAFNSSAQDVFAPMKDAIKTGNAKEVIKFFNGSVDMNLNGEASTYSKAQAEFVLRDFFKKFPATDFKIRHTGSSKGGLQFAIGEYVSNGDNFDVVIRVKEVSGTNLIHELNFVKE